MKGLPDWDGEERTQKVLLYYLQSLYYQSVSDQRAQFNEAAFLVLLSPSVPISPNASPHFIWHRLHLSVLLCSLPLYSSALFLSVHFGIVFNGFFHSALTPSSHLLYYVCVCSCLPQVDYRTEDGTANAGSDYEFAEGTLLFKPGETLKGKRSDNDKL